jgi:putative (di)nucleoside polyphosphate hydrolase
MRRLPELIIPFKRPVYEKVVEAFGPLVAQQA